METTLLTTKTNQERDEVLADFSFTCGAPLQDLELSGKLVNVYIRELSCEDPIEKLYYTAKYPPICVYCAHPMSEADSEIDDEHFPQCEGCSDKSKLSKS